MRGSLEGSSETIGIRLRVVAEFEDGALLKVFGSTEDCRERFFAISAEGRLRHPAVVEISRRARADLFGGSSASN